MIKILHIAQNLTPAAAHILAGIATRSRDSASHQAAFFSSPVPAFTQMLQESGVRCVRPDELNQSFLQSYDILHLHWDDSPDLHLFLRNPLPQCRLLVSLYKAHQSQSPLCSDLLSFCDSVTTFAPPWQAAAENQQLPALPPPLLPAPARAERPADAPCSIGFFVDPPAFGAHPALLEIAARVASPNCIFLVRGCRDADELNLEAQSAGLASRFKAAEHLGDWPEHLGKLDIFAQLADPSGPAPFLPLMLAMNAGAVPVAFRGQNPGGLIRDDENGCLVDDEEQFAEALSRLCGDPACCKRLGENAAARITEIAAQQHWDSLYERLMQQPKRRRFWGIDMRQALLEQTFSEEDLAGKIIPSGPLSLFIEACPGEARELAAGADDVSRVLAAEENILQNAAALVPHLAAYSARFPEEPLLHAWQGLAHLGRGRWQNALQEFALAQGLADFPWRTDWYIALSALRGKKWKLAAEALSRALEGNDFEPARVLLNEINDCNITLRRNSVRAADYAEEYYCTGVKGSGIELLFGALVARGECAYWGSFEAGWRPSGEGFRLRKFSRESFPQLVLPDEVCSFSNRASFNFSYRLPQDLSMGKIVRMERPPIDAAACRASQLVADFGPESDASLGDLIDLPLLPHEGGLFGLSPMEENLVQRRLLELCLPPARRCSLEYERLLAEDLEGFLSFTGLEHTSKSAGSRTEPPMEFRPLDAEKRELEKRCALVEGALRGTVEKPAWPAELLGEACRMWADRAISRFFPGRSEAAADMGRTLRSFAALADKIPMLQAELCALLLRNPLHSKFARERLDELSRTGSRYIKLTAAGMLCTAEAADPRRVQQYAFFLEQLTPAERSHFEAAFQFFLAFVK